MRWKWILGIIVFLIVAVTVTIYAILSSYDFNNLKPQLARMVKDTTGRELFLRGDIELEIGLTPTLVIEDVSFQNASWGSRPELVKIRRLEVQLDVLPLIRRIILFKRLILIDPDILVETNRAGKSNLEFETVPKEQAPSNGKSILSALNFNDIRIEKGRFRYTGGQSGRTYTVNLESATAFAGADGRVALNLNGVYNSKPFRVKATLGSMTELTDPDKTWPVNVTSQISGSTVMIEGAVQDPIKAKGLAITVTGTGRSIPEILKLFNITFIPDLGPFDVTAKIVDPDGRLGLTDIDLKAGGEDGRVRARVTGSIQNLIKGKGLAVTVTGTGPSIPEILKQYNITFIPDLGPFDVTGKLVDPDGRLGLTDIDLKAGGEDGVRARVTGSIQNLIKGKGLAVTVTGTGPSIPEILKQYNITFIPELGPFDVTAKLVDPDGRLELTDIDLKAGGEDGRVRARVTGSIQDLIKRKGLSITVTGTGPSIPEILKQYNITFIPDLGPFDVTAKLVDPDGRLGLTDIDLKAGGEDGRVRARVTGSIQDLIKGKGLAVTVTGTGPSIPEILKQYNITYIPDLGPFNVTGKLVDPEGRLGLTDLDLKVDGEDGVQARVTGSIQDLIKRKGLSITVTGTGPSIPEILKQYNITYIPDLGPFDVTGKLVNPEGRLGIEDLDLKVGTEEMVKTRFMGTVENITAIKGMNLGFDIKGKNIANLEKITGKRMRLSGPFSVSGNAEALSAKSYKISDFKALIQESDLNGSLEINLAGEKPRITADLFSQKLDLRPLLSKKERKPGKPEKDSDILSARKDKIFSDTPLPLEILEKVNAEIEFKAKQLLLTAVSLSDTTARMVLENGHLTINPLKLVTGGGTLDGHFDLHVQDKAAQVTTVLGIDQYELGSMLEKRGISDSLHGNVDMKLELEGRGNSIAELMSGLNGKIMVVMGDGSINQNAIKLLGSDLSSGLLQLLNPLKKKEKYTKINCFAGGFDIKNGLAQSSALVMDTPQVRVFGYGKINLKTEEVDLSLNPIPQKGVGISGLAKLSMSFGELTKPLKLKGTLSKPSLSIDSTGSIITLGKAVGGVALFGPFGVAAILANGQLGGKNTCVAIIEAAEKEFQKSEAEKSEDKKNVIQKTTEGIGNGLRKLMGQ